MQRSGGSGRSAKEQRTSQPRARKAPIAASANGHTAEEFDQLRRERDEVLEQLTATSEVLKIVSSSPHDLSQVFDAMLERATRLCEATHGHVWRFDGGLLHAVAVRGDPQLVEWLWRHNPVAPIPGSAADRVVRGARVDHIADRREEAAYRDNQIFREMSIPAGYERH
jgi:two-component system NtrC family sensor kinase